MTGPSPHRTLRAWFGWRALFTATLVVLCAFGTAISKSQAQGAGKGLAVPAEQGVRWQDLKPAQQVALKPLQQDWSGIDAPRKQKWLQLVAKFPKMSPDEQSRVQARMAEWAQLTPIQRGQARVNFQEAKQVSVQDRQARWEAYQALPPEQKRQLAARAAPSASMPGPDLSHKAAAASARTDKSTREAPQPKSNLVPNPSFAASPKPVSPTVVQAGPGATTSMMTKRPVPPSHQQTGLPKIAATPEFVNQATLLPQRGPQGASSRSAAASAPSASNQP